MSVYDNFGGYVALPIAVAIVGGIIIYYFVVNILPWLVLVALVLAIVIFYFWRRSTMRSAHPWE
jgi:hypothetical protein